MRANKHGSYRAPNAFTEAEVCKVKVSTELFEGLIEGHGRVPSPRSIEVKLHLVFFQVLLELCDVVWG